MNPCARQYVGGYADFSPRLVLDTLPLPVLSSDDDEGLFEGLDVHFVTLVYVGEAAVQITLLLDQVRLLEGVSRCKLAVDLVASLDERLGAHLPAAAGPVLIKCHEVAAHRISLTPSFGECILVLIGESCLGLGLSFTRGHTTSFAAFNSKCNPGLRGERMRRTMTSRSCHEKLYRTAQ